MLCIQCCRYGDFNLEATNWFYVLDTTARCGCAYNYVNNSIKIEIANLCENYCVHGTTTLRDQQIKFVCRLNAEDLDELAKKLHDKILNCLCIGVNWDCDECFMQN